MNKWAKWLLVTLLVGVFSTMAHAFHLPKWEVGVGVAALRLPAYRGAKTIKEIVLPFPYVTYRGERLRVDEEGIRSKLLEGSRYRLDFSLAGNIPVQDDDVAARSGMPGLDPVGEIGPTLDWSVWETPRSWGTGQASLLLRLPMRAVFSVGEPLLAHRGWVFSPSLDLVYQQRGARQLQRWALSAGPLFATRKYHEYFYDVKAEFANASRPQYQAEAGYSGSRITLSLTVNRKDWFLGGFARYDTLSQAVFVDSPLVETENYFAMGFAVSRILSSAARGAAHP